MTLPKPVIFILNEFMVPGVKKELSKIVTSFPFQLKILDNNNIYVEGGMILLRLDKHTIRSGNIMKFEINYYYELEIKKEEIDIEYSFKFDIIEKPNYFSDMKIEIALSLFYFANLIEDL